MSSAFAAVSAAAAPLRAVKASKAAAAKPRGMASVVRASVQDQVRTPPRYHRRSFTTTSGRTPSPPPRHPTIISIWQKTWGSREASPLAGRRELSFVHLSMCDTFIVTLSDEEGEGEGRGIHGTRVCHHARTHALMTRGRLTLQTPPRHQKPLHLD
jgi:hypothetical protein